jgi:2,3-bisphosphoglycerate-dependent phosphoglycerate mutase
MIERLYRLVLVRHGNSDWNLGHRFTGWTDIPLMEQGLAQATIAGKRLAAGGILFDEVHTSVLKRTHQTADAVLTAANQSSIPRYSSWRLNERHYGQLQGMNKQEIFAIWGDQCAYRWWRGYADSPPPLEMDGTRHPRFDPLYAALDPGLLPRSESLADCQRRLLPYWHDVLAPRITANLGLLIVSHGNTIRSLIMYLEKLSPEEVEQVEVPAGVPLVYYLNERLEVAGREWLN